MAKCLVSWCTLEHDLKTHNEKYGKGWRGDARSAYPPFNVGGERHLRDAMTGHGEVPALVSILIRQLLERRHVRLSVYFVDENMPISTGELFATRSFVGGDDVFYFQGRAAEEMLTELAIGKILVFRVETGVREDI